jgi:hypothetical protein
MYYFLFKKYENEENFDLFDNLNKLNIFRDLNNSIKKQHILFCYLIYVSNDIFSYIYNIKFIYNINKVVYKNFSNQLFYSIIYFYLCQEQRKGYNLIVKQLCDL